jgi:hypothetical protein
MGQAFGRLQGRERRMSDLNLTALTVRSALGWAALLAAATLLLTRVDTAAASFPMAVAPLIEPNERLAPGDELGEGRFGASVALSADGSTALAGAPGDHGLVGAVFAFTRSGSSWTQQGPKLTVDESIAPGEEAQCLLERGECGVGGSVTLSADGNTALIGAPRENGRAGAAWIFTRAGSTWSRGQQLTAGADGQGAGRFGRSVALSPDGSTVLIGAPRDNSGRGAAWVFTRTGSTFVRQGPKLVAGEETGEGYFGRSLALSVDGSVALIGSPGDSGRVGAAWAFTRTGTSWSALGGKLGGAGEGGAGRFGFSVALSAAGDAALIGGRTDEGGVGAAWAFTRSGSSWVQQGAKITGGGESGLGEFGSSAALSAGGDIALIGAPHDASPLGAAWVFRRTNGNWTQEGAKLTSSAAGANGSFGASVALASNNGAALIGAPRDNGNSGTVWTFTGTPSPPPLVTAVSPAAGTSAGGTLVTITGTGFLAGAKVTIGTAASSVNVLSDTEITAVTPPGPIGGSEVVVTDLYGTSTASPTYTYLGPPATPASADTTPLSGTPVPGAGVLASFTLSLPPPKLAVSGNLIPISGVVRVKLPGSRRFVLLTTGLQVPVGTIVDARLGTVSLTTAAPHGGTQTATFYTGEFRFTQSRNGVALATLLGGSYASCPNARERAHQVRAASVHAARRRGVRKLWAEGHGSYSTKGNYATGAALGTRWLTEDLCEGTIITVLVHRVTVTNLVTHRRIIVRAGHSYLAKAP